MPRHKHASASLKYRDKRKPIDGGSVCQGLYSLKEIIEHEIVYNDKFHNTKIVGYDKEWQQRRSLNLSPGIYPHMMITRVYAEVDNAGSQEQASPRHDIVIPRFLEESNVIDSDRNNGDVAKTTANESAAPVSSEEHTVIEKQCKGSYTLKASETQGTTPGETYLSHHSCNISTYECIVHGSTISSSILVGQALQSIGASGYASILFPKS
ncbi:hypothetical protein EDD18DRAFT_1115625 [Armillaria luteobubalina]|uniref:Uncharacterized protein n=1 Tax=Armillaria luteobubalina TaxID=153913 RepID=A0AA39UBG3_9AGAR|nr:hypothetical protein EDD18DRAFT_1115625 [Armillaria luteobubalina]